MWHCFWRWLGKMACFSNGVLYYRCTLAVSAKRTVLAVPDTDRKNVPWLWWTRRRQFSPCSGVKAAGCLSPSPSLTVWAASQTWSTSSSLAFQSPGGQKTCELWSLNRHLNPELCFKAVKRLNLQRHRCVLRQETVCRSRSWNSRHQNKPMWRLPAAFRDS